MMKKLSRRQFIYLTSSAGLAWLLAGCQPQPAAQPPDRQPQPTDQPPSRQPQPTNQPTDSQPQSTAQPQPVPVGDQAYLAVARSDDAVAATRAAIAALGGMERFVKSGHDVIIKPNICVDYHPPEYAATTNPLVVATLVELCRAAGAARVRVMDMPFGGTPESAYVVSGIGQAVKDAGGEMEVMSPVKYARTAIPAGKDITTWPIYQDVLKADVLINVPIAKHHSLARLTLGLKNWLGVINNPSQIHRNLNQRIADLASVMRPTLTVVDAMRILLANGPTGGNLDDVKQTDTVIASHDMVAADAYAATLFDKTAADIGYVKAAAEMGLGTLDLDSIKIEEITA